MALQSLMIGLSSASLANGYVTEMWVRAADDWLQHTGRGETRVTRVADVVQPTDFCYLALAYHVETFQVLCVLRQVMFMSRTTFILGQTRQVCWQRQTLISDMANKDSSFYDIMLAEITKTTSILVCLRTGWCWDCTCTNDVIRRDLVHEFHTNRTSRDTICVSKCDLWFITTFSFYITLWKVPECIMRYFPSVNIHYRQSLTSRCICLLCENCSLILPTEKTQNIAKNLKHYLTL